MNYYGIVDKIKDKHESGLYGKRPKAKNEDLKNIDSYFIENLKEIGQFLWKLQLPLFMNEAYKYYGKYKKSISLQHKINSKETVLIFPFELFDDDFRINNSKQIFYGLFDEYKSSKKVFSTLMKSNGGSTLTILEKDNVKFKHYGGKNGKFNNGLYVTHPKDNEILLPLKNFNNLIKTMILEETIEAYEALGAKRMIIEDQTKVSSKISGKKNGAKANLHLDYQKKILREKTFGKGVFDPERALKNKYFIHDFPNIINTLNARIHGNQTKEIFSERVNLNAGLDVGVLEIFSGGAKFNYERKWHFEVEFYDKNDI